MSKQKELEDVLNASLSQEEVEYIKTYWSALYDHPSEFEGDGIVDMVLEDMNKQPNKIIREEKESNKMIDIKSLLFKYNDKIRILHQSPDESLAWGKFNEQNFYVRKLPCSKLEMSPKLSTNPMFSAAFGDSIYRDWIYTFIYTNNMDYIIYVIDGESLINMQTFDAAEFVPDGYTYVGEAELYPHVSKDYNVSYLRYTQKVYVPMNKGANGSIIPVMWYSPKAEEIAGSSIIRLTSDDFIGNDERFSIEKVSEILLNMETRCPAVDVDGREDRYIYTKVMVDNVLRSGFIYNRNHKAMNGDIEYVRKVFSILCMLVERKHEDIVFENLSDYLNGEKAASDIVISAGKSFVKTEVVNYTQMVKELDTSSKKQFSDNPLLRAAQMADPDYM